MWKVSIHGHVTSCDANLIKHMLLSAIMSCAVSGVNKKKLNVKIKKSPPPPLYTPAHSISFVFLVYVYCKLDDHDTAACKFSEALRLDNTFYEVYRGESRYHLTSVKYTLY